MMENYNRHFNERRYLVSFPGSNDPHLFSCRLCLFAQKQNLHHSGRLQQKNVALKYVIKSAQSRESGHPQSRGGTPKLKKKSISSQWMYDKNAK